MQIAKDINRTWADRIAISLHRICFKVTRAWVCGVKNAGKGSSKIIGHLIDFFKDDCSDRNKPPFVYKLREAGGQKDYHKRRILKLSDGRSIEELVEALYREEIADGGWVVCIGLFETQYKREMLDEVNQLIREGHLYRDYREARPVYRQATLSTSEWIRAHKRVYRKIARVNRLCEKIADGGDDNKQTDTAQFLRSLTDIRVTVNSGNSIFTNKETKQIQEITTHIYNNFYAHTN